MPPSTVLVWIIYKGFCLSTHLFDMFYESLLLSSETARGHTFTLG